MVFPGAGPSAGPAGGTGGLESLHFRLARRSPGVDKTAPPAAAAAVPAGAVSLTRTRDSSRPVSAGYDWPAVRSPDGRSLADDPSWDSNVRHMARDRNSGRHR